MGTLSHNFLYACVYEEERGVEQFVEEHAFGILLSGESHFFGNNGTVIAKEGTIGLVRRNQLAKTMKLPSKDGRPFKAINIILDQGSLREYAAARNIESQGRYDGEAMVDLTGNAFLKGYFDSLLPYFDHPEMLTPSLSQVKTVEAIEILLRTHPELVKFLFDFNEPHKIDLESFMNRNYSFNVSMDKFARLTGRSLATFKRDFQKTFNTSPGIWLTKRRLEEAYYLIGKKKKKPAEIYLEIGFESLSHFSYAFKKQYGHAPTRMV